MFHAYLKNGCFRLEALLLGIFFVGVYFGGKGEGEVGRSKMERWGLDFIEYIFFNVTSLA